MKLSQSPPVTILVGPNQVTFEIPKDLLCHNARFFEAALRGPFKEASESKIYMKEDSVSAFEMLFQWIYTGDVIPAGGPAQQIDGYVAFFKLADKVDLLGPLHLSLQTSRIF
jgi:hypothetical protein